jgi:membrane-associated protein
MDIPLLNMTLLELITRVGYVGLFLTIFAESSLFFSLFLPGNSLLFTAGVIAGQGFLNIYILVPVLALAGILGDNFGYWIGSKIGPKIFSREDSKFFNKKHLRRTELFYEKYGSKAVVIARFIPVVRTFVPILAGVGHMRYRTFIAYNIIGSVLWSVGVVVTGFLLGKSIPNIDTFILPLVGLIILISVIPIVLEYLKKDTSNP